MANLFNYIDRPSPIHGLTGATKLLCLFIWSGAAMSTYDTRLLVFLSVMGLVLLKVARIKWKDVSFVLSFIGAFLLINSIFLYIFSPGHGSELYGTVHYVFGYRGHYALTYEQMFYQFNYILKSTATIPVVLLFVCTTNPSEFAASLNKIGVSYSVAYSVALALRYIPDVQREYHEISQAQQARGIEMSKKASLINRLKGATSILIPLILSSMERIDIISNAMELRGFGKNRKRTWYRARKFRKADFLSIFGCLMMLAAAIILNIVNGSRFYNPFI